MSDEESGPARVVLDGTQTVRTITAAHATLLKALTEQQEVEVDCGAAEIVDISLIQLLLSARLTAHQAGKRLVLSSASSALRNALEQGGFLSPAAPDPFWPDDV